MNDEKNSNKKPESQPTGRIFDSREKAVAHLNTILYRVGEQGNYLRTTGGKYRLMNRSHTEDEFANFQYQDEGRLRPAFPAWLRHTHRATVDSVDHLPGHPPLSIVQRGDRTLFNTWPGPAVYESEEIQTWLNDLGWTAEKLCDMPFKTLCKLMPALYEYFDDVFCSREPDADILGYLLDYLAHIVQHPATLPGTAVMLLGAPGSGKSFLGLNVLRPLVNPVDFIQQPSRGVTGQWTGQYANKLIGMVDDPRFPRDSEEAMSNLKSLITESPFTYEDKHMKGWRAENCLRLLINLNDNMSLRLDPNDRRFTVIRTSTLWREDTARFGALTKRLFGKQRTERGNATCAHPADPEDGYFWLFYHWLKNRKITRDLRVKLGTESGSDYTRQGGNDVYTWLLACSEAKEWLNGEEHPEAWFEERPESYGKQELYAWYQKWSSKREDNARPVSQKRFFNEIKTWLDVRDARKKNDVTGEMVRVYLIPPVDQAKL